jgi:hypothetical protein
MFYYFIQARKISQRYYFIKRPQRRQRRSKSELQAHQKKQKNTKARQVTFNEYYQHIDVSRDYEAHREKNYLLDYFTVLKQIFALDHLLATSTSQPHGGATTTTRRRQHKTTKRLRDERVTTRRTRLHIKRATTRDM